MIGSIDEKPADFLDEEDLQEVLAEITEYEDRMQFDPDFIKEDFELREYLEVIDPEDE